MRKRDDPQWWKGTRRDGHSEIFAALEESVTEENYPQFTYVHGPFKSEAEAKAYVDTTGFFTDPFCNAGKGR